MPNYGSFNPNLVFNNKLICEYTLGAALTASMLLGLSAFKMPNKRLIKHFSLGKYDYSLYQEDYYVHDGNVDGAFLVVYRAGQTRSLCSAWMKASRNKVLLTKGTHTISRDGITFTEVYFDHHRRLDSMTKAFTADDMGNLHLHEVKEYHDGQVKKTFY